MGNGYFSEFPERNPSAEGAARGKAMLDTMMAELKDDKDELIGAEKLGKAVAKSRAGQPFDPAGDLQSSGFKAQRTGERADYGGEA